MIREFWCPDNGGYVREIDETHPGTLGQQMSESLATSGNMMHCSRPGNLPAMIRRARRRELAELARENVEE